MVCASSCSTSARTFAAPAPFRVAVALVGGPGVALAVRVPGGCAGHADGFDEACTAQQRGVEAGCELLGRIVFDGPAGRDDAAHADLDERFGDVGCETGAVILHEHRCRVAAGEVAAVQKHQFGHGAHRVHLIRAEVGVQPRQHHAAVLTVLAVAGDVDDAVGPLEQGVDDGLRVVVIDQRPNLDRGDAAARRSQPRGDRNRFAARTVERRVEGRVALGLADHEHVVVRAGIDHLSPKVLDLQLADQLAPDRPGP